MAKKKDKDETKVISVGAEQVEKIVAIPDGPVKKQRRKKVKNVSRAYLSIRLNSGADIALAANEVSRGMTMTEFDSVGIQRGLKKRLIRVVR